MLRAAMVLAVAVLGQALLWARETKWVTVADQQEVPEVIEAPPTANPQHAENARSDDDAYDQCDGPRCGGGQRAGRLMGRPSNNDILFGNGNPYCPDAYYVPCWQVFGGYLFLRPGHEKVSYAVPVNGPDVPLRDAVPVQVGTEAVTDVKFCSGFRAGFTRALSDCATLGATYSYFDGTAEDAIHVAAPLVLHSQVRHQSTQAAATDNLDASASLGVLFQLADIEYRRVLVCGDLSEVSGVLGVRYGHLRQDFSSSFASVTTIESVASDITFDGAGLRLGLEGEQHIYCSGLMVYGKTFASFLGGTEQARYVQTDNFHGTVVNTGWNEDRIVSILDLELGVGWCSPGGRLRLTAGWLVSAWLNTINSGDFIRAVQNNSSNQSKELSNAVTFDGLTSRLEFRF